MNREQCLQAALDAVNNRPKAYGPPEQNFGRIAALWNVYLDGLPHYDDLVAHDVAIMLALLKIARLMENPSHSDSYVDLAGYAACGAEVRAATLEEVSTAELEPPLGGPSDDEKPYFNAEAVAVGCMCSDCEAGRAWLDRQAYRKSTSAPATSEWVTDFYSDDVPPVTPIEKVAAAAGYFVYPDCECDHCRVLRGA